VGGARRRGVGRDVEVTDSSGMRVLFVDGTQVAELKAKAFSMVKDKMTMTLTTGAHGRCRAP
jgi:hypothetical protein